MKMNLYGSRNRVIFFRDLAYLVWFGFRMYAIWKGFPKIRMPPIWGHAASSVCSTARMGFLVFSAERFRGNLQTCDLHRWSFKVSISAPAFAHYQSLSFLLLPPNKPSTQFCF
jgi:hypothetical protein